MFLSFCSTLNKFNNINPQNKDTEKKKVTVYNNASEQCNEYLEIYLNHYKALPDVEKIKLSNKYHHTNLFFKTYSLIT